MQRQAAVVNIYVDTQGGGQGWRLGEQSTVLSHRRPEFYSFVKQFLLSLSEPRGLVITYYIFISYTCVTFMIIMCFLVFFWVQTQLSLHWTKAYMCVAVRRVTRELNSMEEECIKILNQTHLGVQRVNAILEDKTISTFQFMRNSSVKRTISTGWWMIPLPAVPFHFHFIINDINSKSKNNKLAVRDITTDSDWWGKVPHLAPWQQAMALSGLMNYIDTQAILMTLSIDPSPLSFLSLFPALGLAPISSHCSNIQHGFWSLLTCVFCTRGE